MTIDILSPGVYRLREVEQVRIVNEAVMITNMVSVLSTI